MSFGQRFKRQGRGQRAHSGIQSIFGKRKPRKHYPSNLNNGINYNSGRVPPFWRQQHPASQQYPQYPTSQQYPQYPASQQYPQYPASQQYPQYPASQQYPQYPVAQQQQAGQQLSPEQRSQNDGQLSVYLFKYSAPDNVNEEELHAYERAFRSKWDTFNDPNKKPSGQD
ncbi:hypothetical protein N7462_001552 [Penicillium macrosclerotiorum]|uniref:uncharacterized protein n=1 Tax=Penicillium macrosclerotiorum TaxID=303699 RepID=UPI0025496B77|nr:uncharacterized protein N7462_001552 [Penicillium macrosclerotiorum]KAJ5692129.1 hypothetical protein N7462_001552 [Penicillium macrosclerotiorum]